MPADLYQETQMGALTPEAAARKAIARLLQKLEDDPECAYYINLGSQTFSLLTEAYAMLTGQPLQAIRERYANRNARNPRCEIPVEISCAIQQKIDSADGLAEPLRAHELIDKLNQHNLDRRVTIRLETGTGWEDYPVLDVQHANDHGPMRLVLLTEPLAFTTELLRAQPATA